MATQRNGKVKTRPPKFNYDSEDFYSEIEELASQGLTDKDIAWALVGKFGERLTPQWFATLKNETDGSGVLTPRATRILEALMRGRTACVCPFYKVKINISLTLCAG